MPRAATASSIGLIMSVTSGAPSRPPVTQTREFWVLMAYAVALGIFGAFAGLVFVGVTGFGNHWYVDSDPRWFGGHWWWIAVALIGGASLGPEKALGAIGGGAGSLLAERRGRTADGAKVNTLSGFAGAYGGLFSSTVIVVMLIMEAARPGGQRFTKALAGAIVASSVSFGIYFAIAGAAFVAVYRVPGFTFEDWQLGAGVLPGIFAAILVTLLAVFIQGAARLFGRLKGPETLRPALGGAAFGLVGVVLPLTIFTGTAQLSTVLKDAGRLGAGLLAVTLIGKMFTFAVCQATGFLGGPIFPALFLGGTAGVIVHLVIPGVPLGLAFACLLAAVPGSLVAAPFTMVLLAAFLTQVGALQTAPVLLAVITAYLALEGIRYFVASRRRTSTVAAEKTAPA
jgi:H+/Cl- antiporter ClcA